MNNGYIEVSKYDRQYAALHEVSLCTKPSTIKNVTPVTGKTETFIVQTFRHEDSGDYIFVECVDELGTTRLALPPKVASAIASQRDSLTTRRRSISSRRVMKARMASGDWKPPVPPKRRKKA